MLDLVVTFCAEITQYIHGTPTYAQLVQTNRRTFERFKSAIRSTAPAFLPFTEKVRQPGRFIKLDEEGSDTASDSEELKVYPMMYLGDVRKKIRE